VISKSKTVGKIVWQFMRVALSKYGKSVKLWNVYEIYLLTREAFKRSYIPIQNWIFNMLNVMLDFSGTA